ncbi:MAG TPA: hypothetical protein VFA93_02245 [Patescibacteria group bacterium]|nr:hypothetical protein [Patescibacteria group bacterium]
MIKRTQERVVAAILDDSKQKYFVLLTGVATFVFGFAAGALLNIYLILTHSSVFGNLRTSLSYKSSVFGDGFILPIINMFAMWFILQNAEIIKEKNVKLSILSGLLITLYFHINQAARGLVNWAMPTPWHWNALGAFHFVYMFVAFSFVSLFYTTVFKYIRIHKILPKEALIVTIGGIIFLVLLRLDYIAVNLSLPRF